MQSKFLLTSFLIFSAVGCATPVQNDRRGLFDQLKPGSRFSTPIPKARENRQVEENALAHLSLRFQWPVRFVDITSPFGLRGKEFHEGIDLHAPKGTRIYAVQDGTVIYSDSKVRGYGKMVVLRHEGKTSTIYAHNSKLLVRKGQKIKKGQLIALSGATGHARGPHLHFEIRQGLVALNPIRFLPRMPRKLAMR